MTSIKKALRQFRRDDRGVTLVEYGIAVTLAVVVGTVLLTNLGSAINGQLDSAADCMKGSTVAADGTVTNTSCATAG